MALQIWCNQCFAYSSVYLLSCGQKLSLSAFPGEAAGGASGRAHALVKNGVAASLQARVKSRLHMKTGTGAGASLHDRLHERALVEMSNRVTQSAATRLAQNFGVYIPEFPAVIGYFSEFQAMIGKSTLCSGRNNKRTIASENLVEACRP